MAVIINDFEVIMDTPEEAASGETPEAAAPPAMPLSPQDIHDILRRQMERIARLRAH